MIHPTRRLQALTLALLLAAAGPACADDPGEIRALLARGEYGIALERAQKAADASPRDAQARFLVGVVLMDMGRDADALALFTRMTQEYPELPDPFNNIALLHARAGKLELARQALETALRNDPAHRTARANLGQVYVMLAVQAWEQVAAAGPLDSGLQRKLEAARSLLGGPAR
jgi:Flp pilus assembly protein TadD